MASKLNYSTALRNAKMDAITTAVGNAGKLKIYDGTQPAGPGTAITTQTLLATYTLGSPFAAGASNGVLSPTAPASTPNAAATGTATWFRITKSDDTAVIDGSVSTSGADCNLSSTSFTNGVAAPTITSLSFTDGNSGH